MTREDPTARGQWEQAWMQLAPPWATLNLERAYVVGPFENLEFQGLWVHYAPEERVDLQGHYEGKGGRPLRWQRIEASQLSKDASVDLGQWIPAEPWSVVYLYGEVVVSQREIIRLAVESSGIVYGWLNGTPVLAPTIPEPAALGRDQAWGVLEPGTNRLLLKLVFFDGTWGVRCSIQSYGSPSGVMEAMARLTASASTPTIRLVTRYVQAEVAAALNDPLVVEDALRALETDPLATRWDRAWTRAIREQYSTTGRYLPLHDVVQHYEPVQGIPALDTFWPQSNPPAEELLVVDVSELPPHSEFAMAVLQGLVNRSKPRLYLLHSRYARQDRQWLDELVFEGYRARPISVNEAWDLFRDEVRGAILYDGSIMDEIGAYHSDQLNQTNVLMMIGALESAVPLTPEMNQALGLQVVFDARGKWATQYEMMRWAYETLFPQMDHRILATNYPGIFLLTDYLVQFKIFTFWFPQYRTLCEENLLRGILASTPPNTPIIGWWFDWMPNPKDPEHRHADAVMETPGLLRGSYFGKVLTPSHEATNLSVHSGVAVGNWHHKPCQVPELDPAKVYYTYLLSDGDNLGEALMMRTRDLQWDREERGQIPMGWSFAPAAARMAPPVLNYYLRTASEADLLVGGLGVGYTEPVIYLRAFPEFRATLYDDYARMTNEALKWIDTSCLWLINGTATEEDIYARGSDGQLQGIFTGYGGHPDLASVRIGPNGVAIFRPATSMVHGKSREQLIDTMVSEIRQAAARVQRPAFIEAWVLNWAWSIDMLQEVQQRLGSGFVLVRPDVLAQLARDASSDSKDL